MHTVCILAEKIDEIAGLFSYRVHSTSSPMWYTYTIITEVCTITFIKLSFLEVRVY